MPYDNIAGVPVYRGELNRLSVMPYGTTYDSDLRRYTWGQCHALALAIHELTGWELWGDDSTSPHHVLVRMPSGMWLDVEGEHDDEGFEPLDVELFARIVDRRSNGRRDYAVPVLDEHTVTLARQLVADYSEEAPWTCTGWELTSY